MREQSIKPHYRCLSKSEHLVIIGVNESDGLRAGALTQRTPAAPDRRRGRLRCAVARYVSVHVNHVVAGQSRSVGMATCVLRPIRIRISRET